MINELLNQQIYSMYTKNSEMGYSYDSYQELEAVLFYGSFGWKLLYSTNNIIKFEPLSNTNYNFWKPIIIQTPSLISTIGFIDGVNELVDLEVELMCESYDFLMYNLLNYQEGVYNLNQLAKICSHWKGLSQIDIIEAEFLKKKLEE